MTATPTRTTRGGLLGLYAQTSVHPGAGTALGTVDLPVQRERHTHWPNVAGSALKGILRDACREQVARDPNLDDLERFDDERDEQGTVTKRADRSKEKGRAKADATMLLDMAFGPPAGKSSDFAGALSVTDARLLVFPVRSLKGVFAWVTCPMALDRLKRDAALVGLPVSWPIPNPKDNEAVVSATSCNCLVGESLVLEEFEFAKAAQENAKPIADWVATNLLPNTEPYAATVKRFPKQFVILHDDWFTHFAQHATEVVARVGLDYETKTVKSGALFYQEFLPAETLMYAVVLANAARTRFRAANAESILNTMTGSLQSVLQVGGDETIGKGYCATRFLAGEGGEVT